MKSDSQGFLIGDRVAAADRSGSISGLSVLRSIEGDVGVIRRLLEAGAGQRFKSAARTAVPVRGRESAAVAKLAVPRLSGGPGGGTPGRQQLTRMGAAVVAVARSGATGGGGGSMPARDARGRFVSGASAGPAVVVAARGAPSAAGAAGSPAAVALAEQKERDARGRFAGGGGGQGSDFAGGDGVLGKISNTLEGIGDAVGNADQIDPTLAALKEIQGVVSPVGRGIMSLGQRLAERRKERWYSRILKAVSGNKDEGGGSGASGGDVKTGSFLGTFFGEMVGRAASMALPLLAAAGALLLKGAGLLGAAAIGSYIGTKIYDWLTESGLMAKIFDAFDSIKGYIKDKLDSLVGGAKKAVQVVAKVRSDSQQGSDDARYRTLAPEDRREARLAKRGSAPDSMAYKAGAVAGTVMRGADVAGNQIRRLLGVKGTERTYENTDGSVEKRSGGTVSWRNNNPGNMKFEYAGSADKTVRSKRTREQALASAQKRYEGVVDLDQFGNAIFASEAQGRAAKAGLLRGTHGGRTVEEMLPKYAITDYSGTANHKAYAAGIHKTAEAKGVSLRGKKIADLSPDEMNALLDGMKKVEGFKTGAVTVTGGMPGSRPGAVAAANIPPIRAASVPMSVPERMPAAQAAKIPDRINSGDQVAPSVVIRGEVGQDVADRRIAHVATGAIGGKS